MNFDRIMPMTPETLRLVLAQAERHGAARVAFATKGESFTALYHQGDDVAWKILPMPEGQEAGQ